MSTANLYIVFILIGIILFACVYFFSKLQLKRRGELNGNAQDDFLMQNAQSRQQPELSENEGVEADFTGSSNVNVGGVTATVTPSSHQNDTTLTASEIDSVPLDVLAEELSKSSNELGDVNGDQVSYSHELYDDAVVQEEPNAQIDIFSEAEVSNETKEESQLTDTPKKQQSSFFNQTELEKRSDDKKADDLKSVQVGNIQKPSAKPPVIIEDTEIVASFTGGDVVLRDDVLSTYRNFDYLFTRKTGIFGKSSLTNVWENIDLSDSTSEFNDVAVSLQLADKTGAMTRKESNTFSTMALELADRLKRKVTFSLDIDAAIDRGRELDEMARRHDAMVVCNVVPKRKQGFRSTDIKSCTRDLNMVQSSNGVFGRFDKVGQKASLRYSLAVAGESGDYITLDKAASFYVRDIVLFVKVPLVVDPVNAFNLMVEDARRLAAWLDGKLVDRNGKNMTSRTLETLSGQIVGIEQQMASEGVVPGSELCKKLF